MSKFGCYLKSIDQKDRKKTKGNKSMIFNLSKSFKVLYATWVLYI